MLQWTWWCIYFFGVNVFVYFRKITRTRTAGSYSSSLFNFLRNLHTVFPSGCTNLHSHQRGISVPCFPDHCQQLLFVIFLIIAILTGVKCYLIVVLICISLMINDIEHLSIYLLAICMPCLEKCLFKPSAHFKIRLFVVCYWIVWILYILYFGY